MPGLTIMGSIKNHEIGLKMGREATQLRSAGYIIMNVGLWYAGLE